MRRVAVFRIFRAFACRRVRGREHEAGNSFLTEKCALVPAYSNIAAAGLDPLSVSVKSYADAGNLIDNYNYLPDDHFSLCGAAFQKYLAGQTDRAGLASEIENYWSSTTPVEH